MTYLKFKNEYNEYKQKQILSSHLDFYFGSHNCQNWQLLVLLSFWVNLK